MGDVCNGRGGIIRGGGGRGDLIPHKPQVYKVSLQVDIKGAAGYHPDRGRRRSKRKTPAQTQQGLVSVPHPRSRSVYSHTFRPALPPMVV